MDFSTAEKYWPCNLWGGAGISKPPQIPPGCVPGDFGPSLLPSTLFQVDEDQHLSSEFFLGLNIRRSHYLEFGKETRAPVTGAFGRLLMGNICAKSKRLLLVLCSCKLSVCKIHPEIPPAGKLHRRATSSLEADADRFSAAAKRGTIGTELLLFPPNCF